jgi:radical SAM protein with 4Fe4S-binding SPASM domain
MHSFLRKLKEVGKIASYRPRGWKALLFNTAMAMAKKTGPLMRPVHVSIEPTNTCNARCPVCETGKGEMTRPVGMLDFTDYQKLIDEIWPTTSTLLFYFMGEPFLNRHAYDMIRYARQRDIYVETCTNGDFVDAKGVIYSDINKISFQIGGMDDATHQIYRIRSNLERIRKNLYELIEERRKHPESNVEIEVGFIVMRQNENQVEEFISWAQDLGVDTASVIDPCVRNMEEARSFLPRDRKYWFYDEEAFEHGSLKPKYIPDNGCVWIWNSIMINWNGDAVPCCRDANGKHILGNVFQEGLGRVFNGKRAREFRRSILKAQREIDICHLCSGFGLPSLEKEKPMAFAIKRHSFDSTPLDPLESCSLSAKIVNSSCSRVLVSEASQKKRI